MGTQRPLQVYIVEDEVIFVMLLKKVLQKLGCEVCGHALNGETALADFKKNTPDVIIMDIFIQGAMTGVDIAEILNKDYDFNRILYLTANSEPQTREKAYATDHIAYISKPVHFEVLEQHFKKIQQEIAL